MMNRAEESYNQVRHELYELGLLVDGVYLDQIELWVSPLRENWPYARAHGFVYDRGVGLFDRLLGFKDGAIYLATQSASSSMSSGSTLTDVVRHEYAHAWYWLDPTFVNGPWFTRTFGSSYHSDPNEFGEAVWESFYRFPEEFSKSGYHQAYATPYAMCSSYEDFAETFAFLLKNQKSLHRFKSRPQLLKKINAVQSAIKRKARLLGL